MNRRSGITISFVQLARKYSQDLIRRAFLAVAALVFTLVLLETGVVGAVYAASAEDVDDEVPAAVVPFAGVQKEDESLSWQFPPLPWSSKLTVGVGFTRLESGGSTGTRSENFSVSGQSYVWAPWFLRLSGNTSFSDSAALSGSKSTSRGFGFGLYADVLPYSKLPTTASISHSVAKAISSVETTTNATALSLRQDLRLSEGSTSSNWSYNNSLLSSNQFPASRFQTFSLSSTASFPGDDPQSLAGAFTWSGRNSGGEATGNSVRLDGSHAIYLENYVMSLSSDASVVSDSARDSASQTEVSLIQAGTTMDWIPSDDYPLRLGGNVRAFDTRQETSNSLGGTTSSVAKTSLVGLSARYPLAERVDLSGGLNAYASGGNAGKRLGGQVITTLTWSGEGVRDRWGDWDWNVTYGSGLSAFRNWDKTNGMSTSANSMVASGSASQSLSRQFDVDWKAPLGVTISQGYGASVNLTPSASGERVGQSLGHGFSVSSAWREGVSIYQVSASYSDSRSFADQATNFQSLNLSANGAWQLTSLSSLDGSVGGGLSRQSPEGGGFFRGWQGGLGAGGGYQRRQFAGVFGLLYTANYSAQVRETGAVSGQSDAATRPYAVTQNFVQRLNWRLGLLGWRFEHSASRTETGGVVSTLFLYVERDFSGVL